ncbi:ADP-ribosylation factor-like protein 5A [Fukomys damarensis]|uniref:ADP-ribosylation factor-like protein 5A n=2 Tax=Hystricomorpha TaxID=33550 RepID=A0A091D4G6_FUKDA|nr:ADP-ribosylation factor-like protein 5A [Fukomys damarensis]
MTVKIRPLTSAEYEGRRGSTEKDPLEQPVIESQDGFWVLRVCAGVEIGTITYLLYGSMEDIQGKRSSAGAQQQAVRSRLLQHPAGIATSIPDSMNEVVHTSPTIGSNVEEIVINNTCFLMWDIGGQESLRSSWNTYYTNTEFVIVVVDSTDRERISVTREELYKMLAHEDLRKAGLLIFANKQDVKECMTVAEISQFLKLTSIKDHQWHIQACCALTGEGLCQGLEWMMSRLKIR